MMRAVVGLAVAADAGAVNELVVARQSSLYGESAFSPRPRPLHASPVRKQGVGAALLSDAFGPFWQRGERSVGLVDVANDTRAFRLYERAGMTPALGWVVYEQALGNAA